jgi:hypothetical protein
MEVAGNDTLHDEVTKGKPRWRITFSSGGQEIVKSPEILRKKVAKGDVAKVESGRARVVLAGDTKQDFEEIAPEKWVDVSTDYL